MRAHRLARAPAGSCRRALECHRRARRTCGRAVAHVLRAHGYRRRRGHGRAVHARHPRRPALRPRVAGYERRSGRDDRRGACRGRAGPREGPADRRGGCRRGVREHRRGRARARVDGRRAPSSPSQPTCRSRSVTRGLPGSTSRRAAGPRTAAGREMAGTPSCAWGECSIASRRSTASCSQERRTRSWAPVRCTRRSSTGGRELSSYPDRCRLQMERRTGWRRKRRRALCAKCARSSMTWRARIRSLRRPRVEFFAPALRVANGSSNCRICWRAQSKPRGFDSKSRHELLDRRCSPWRSRHSVGPVRAGRCRPPQPRGIRQRPETS